MEPKSNPSPGEINVFCACRHFIGVSVAEIIVKIRGLTDINIQSEIRRRRLTAVR
jgi:hypothetical protein